MKNLCTAIRAVIQPRLRGSVTGYQTYQVLDHMLTGSTGDPLCLEVSSLSFRHRGHLYRQVGIVQDHMGIGGCFTVRPKVEIAQRSIDLTFAPLHFGHVGLDISF